MAGIQWKGGKLTMQKAGALRVHLGQEDRVKREHSNPDIDKTKSHLNYCLGCNDYEDAHQSMRRRVKEVDERNPPKRLKNANQRIVAMSLVAYCPQTIVEQGKEDEFFKELHSVYKDFFGKDLHGQFVHKDEIHQYIDPQTHETKTSLPHSHTLVSAYAEWAEKDKKTGEVSERKGINGKNFSSTARINQLNAVVDRMCRAKFGVPYITGEGKKKGKTVEQLKVESKIETLKDLADVAKDVVQELLDKKDELLTENEQLQKVNDEFVQSLEPSPTKVEKNVFGKEKEVPKTEEELQRDREVKAAQAVLQREEALIERERSIADKERQLERARTELEADTQAMTEYLTEQQAALKTQAAATEQRYKQKEQTLMAKVEQKLTELAQKIKAANDAKFAAIVQKAAYALERIPLPTTTELFRRGVYQREQTQTQSKER